MSFLISKALNNLSFETQSISSDASGNTTISGDTTIDSILINGPAVIKTLDNNQYNLQTTTMGNASNILQSDGFGGTYWGNGSTSESGIVYNGSIPASVGQHIIISNPDGTTVSQSRINEGPTNLDIDSLNVTNANNIECNLLKNIDGNVLTIQANQITCVDIQTDDAFSVNYELQKIDNFLPSTLNNTNITGNVVCDKVLTNQIFGKTSNTTFIDFSTPEDIDVLATNFTYNGNQVATLSDIPPQSNPFNQDLNTTNNVNFNKVNVFAAIVNNTQLTTKLYVDSAISGSTQDFQSVYNASSTPATITMTAAKIINYTRSDNPILTLDSLNYKLTSQDVSVAQITSNNYFPPNSNNLNDWSLSPYIFNASASSVINAAHIAGTSFTYVAATATDGWICSNNKYDITTGLPSALAASTNVDGVPILGEWLQLSTSIAVSINGFYYGGLTTTLESNTAVNFKLVGSNDGVIFTLLSSQTAQTILYPGKQYTIPTTTSYKYFRYIIESIIPNNFIGRCAVGSGTAFDIILSDPCKIRLLDNAVEIDGDFLTATNFIKKGGTNQQYLMADGSSLQYSANSGNSNFYLYNNASGVMTPPPVNGQIGYNNSVQANATTLYISHRTRDSIDIDVFLAQLTTSQDVYIQDQENSLNYIRYNIIGTPTITPNSYITIPVFYLGNGGGTGLTNFGSNHNLLVSFFTNSIEVDARLTTLENKTQNINSSGSSETIITSSILSLRNIHSLNTGDTMGIGLGASLVNIDAPMNINDPLTTQSIVPALDNIYNIGAVSGAQYKNCYIKENIICPNYDIIGTLNIGPITSTNVNIGRTGITSTILGTTNINSVYTLPNTAPAVGNVLTCSALGISSWITPSPTAYSFLYPFPVISKTVTTLAGNRTLACAYTMTTNYTFTTTGVFHPSPGSDNNRVGIYRGDLTTGVLVGQTLNTPPASGYNVKPLTAVIGQSLTFTLGQQIVIVWTQNGGGTSIATTTGVSNIALAFLSGTGYSATLPTTMAGFASPSATTIRMCIDLS
jgi:hypothetical protein